MTTPGLPDLLAERDRAHRLDGTCPPMTSVADLVAWLCEVRLALVSGRSAVPNAAEAIVGRPIRGSWWGDRDSSLVYRLLEELEAVEAGYLDVVLVDSKRTLVHPDLVPLIASVAAERGRRARAVDALPTPARQLLARLEKRAEDKAGGARAEAPADRGARGALEAALLARSVSMHTETGRHVSIMEIFGHLPAPATVSYRSALARLVEATLRSARVAPEREVLGWFRKVEPDPGRRRDAVDSLTCRRLIDDRVVWLAVQ